MNNDENKLPIEPSELTNNKPPELPPTPTRFEAWKAEHEPKLSKLMLWGLILTLIGLLSSIIAFIIFVSVLDFPLILLFIFIILDLIGIGFTIAALTTKTRKKIYWVYLSGVFGFLFGMVLGIVGGIILIAAKYYYANKPRY